MCIILASTSSLTRAIVKNHIPIKKENIIVNVYICIGLYCPASAEQTNLSTYVKTPRSTKVPVVCNHQTKYVLYCTGLGLYMWPCRQLNLPLCIMPWSIVQPPVGLLHWKHGSANHKFQEGVNVIAALHCRLYKIDCQNLIEFIHGSSSVAVIVVVYFYHKHRI